LENTCSQELNKSITEEFLQIHLKLQLFTICPWEVIKMPS